MTTAVNPTCPYDGQTCNQVGEHKCSWCYRRRQMSTSARVGTSLDIHLAKQADIVFAFMYSGDYYSGLQVVSLHRTRAGAENAMRKHKEACLSDFIDIYGIDELKSKDCGFGKWETWEVVEMIITD